MSKSSTIEDFNLISNYETVRQTLLEEKYADRLKKPLAYWVLPNDRRLPLAFLNRSLSELLSTPFEELSATPGIGQKKISSLVKLLHRATKDEPPGLPEGVSEFPSVDELENKPNQTQLFDPSIVSEALWAEWRQIVKDFKVGHEKLGRLAPSLKRMPTVIWHTPLREYLDQSISDIKRLRTHGEKRVRCVLEVFHTVYSKLSKATSGDDIRVLLTPKRICHAQRWIASQLQSASLPTHEEIRSEFAIPLLDQLKIDSGDTVYRLADERLGIHGNPQSVRDQSRNLGVTRARVYQLLDDCSKVMQVRWPEGKAQLDSLTTKFAGAGPDSQHLALFYGIREMCYPEKMKPVVHSGRAVESASSTGMAESPATTTASPDQTTIRIDQPATNLPDQHADQRRTETIESNAMKSPHF